MLTSLRGGVSEASSLTPFGIRADFRFVILWSDTPEIVGLNEWIWIPQMRIADRSLYFWNRLAFFGSLIPDFRKAHKIIFLLFR